MSGVCFVLLLLLFWWGGCGVDARGRLSVFVSESSRVLERESERAREQSAKDGLIDKEVYCGAGVQAASE